jgi:nitrate reductase molybdenum cofactor assembly chaperone NarJ/NarW
MRFREHRQSSKATVYKLCSVLLQYPDAEILDGRSDLLTAADELPASAAVNALRRFCRWFAGADPLALQQQYVETFDLDKRCGLYLGFYGEGDRRQRGMALLRLKRLYRAGGYELDRSELPDYLPLMLEFAAAAPDGRGEIVLREHRAALELLCRSLADRGSVYADLVDAVCLTVGEASATDRARAIAMAAAGPPRELVGLEPFAPGDVMPGNGARR